MKRNVIVGLSLFAIVLYLCPAFALDNQLFNDVDESAWYYQYIELCTEEGLMTGDGNGNFYPDDFVSVAEVMTVCAKIHHRLSGETGEIPPVPEEGVQSLIYFTDNKGIKIASANDIQWVIHAGDNQLLIVFHQAVTAQLQENEESSAQLTMHLPVGEPATYICEYAVGDSPMDTGYMIQLEKDDVIDRFLWIINYDGSIYSEIVGKWYEKYILYIQLHTYDRYQRQMGNFYQDYEDQLAENYASNYIENNSPTFESDCTRMLIAYYLSLCIPDDYFGEVNEPVSIPDFDSPILDRLYQAGILSGVDDQGTFCGRDYLTRAQMATIVARSITYITNDTK